MHAFFANAAFAVALAMLAVCLFSLVALLCSPVYDRLANLERFLRVPSALFLLWLVLHYAAAEGYFSALWFALLFGWMDRASKTKTPLTRSGLVFQSVFLAAAGGVGVLSYFNLIERVLGPVGVFPLKPLVLIPGSFAIVLLVVWMNTRHVAPNHVSSSTTPSHV